MQRVASNAKPVFAEPFTSYANTDCILRASDRRPAVTGRIRVVLHVARRHRWGQLWGQLVLDKVVRTQRLRGLQ